MPIDLIAAAFDLIIGQGLELAKDKAKRSERILKILNAIGLKHDAPPANDFDGVYAYTLVVYGIDKPTPILEFFHHEFIKSAFRKSFEQKDISILEQETESFLGWNEIGKDIRAIDYDPRQEFAEFQDQFVTAAKLTRTVQEVLVDQSLEDISSGIQELPTRHDLTAQLSNLKNDIIEVSEKANKPKDTFLSPYFRLVQLSDYQPATDNVLKKYYKGELLLSWQILSAEGDVERDMKDDLVHNYFMPQNRVRMLCLSGEAGEGKSTLAWRIATEIAESTQQLLFQILNSEADEPWNVLESFVQNQGASLILLADDIFRNASAQRNLENLNPGLPVTIIVTSRSNEVPSDLRLPFSIEMVKMENPSRTEKDRVLSKLNLQEGDLTIVQRKRLEHSTSWLVMMLEITTGESLTKIIQSSINRLRRQDDVVYRAYEYICFAGQYNLAIPETLLNRLDNSGRFYNLLDHPASKGLIFPNIGLEILGRQRNRYQERMLCVQHPTIAQTALRVYQRDPLSIIKEFINAVQPDSPEQTFFIGVLLYVLILDEQVPLVIAVLRENFEKLDEIFEMCGTTDIIHRWIPIFQYLNDQPKVNILTSLALNKFPTSTADWKALFRVVMERGTKEQVLTTIDSAEKWLIANLQDTTVRPRYIGFVEKRGTPEQLARLIGEIGEWLDTNVEDTVVRTAYMGLVKRRGTLEQITKLCDGTKKWLLSYPPGFSTTVHDAYLGLVGKYGTKPQITELIDDTLLWLKGEHQGSQYIRNTFLGLVDRYGTLGQRNKTISDTIDWLDSHPQNKSVRVAFMRLIESHGARKQISNYIDEIFEWLNNHLYDTTIRSNFLGFVERNGTEEQIIKLMNNASEWLAASPRDSTVRVGYIALVGRRGTKDQLANVIEETARWLTANPQDTYVRVKFMSIVENHGTKQAIDNLINDTTQWLENNPQDSTCRAYYLGLILRHGTREQISKVIDDTAQWLNIWTGELNIRAQFLSLVRIRGNLTQINHVIDSTSKWIAANPQGSRHILAPYQNLVNSSQKQKK